MLMIVWVLSLVAMVTGDFTFTCNQPPNQAGPQMPSLPDQYEMRVETNIVQAQKTVEVYESYDYKGGQVALTLIRDGQVSKSIHNFATQERYDILPNDTCITTSITDSSENFNIFGFTMKGKDGKISIASVSDIFKIGSKYNISYVGEAQIRGIPVYQWTSCQVSEELHASFKLDYYFSRPTYVNADGGKLVPVRFAITGQATNKIKTGYHNFTHVYEFSVFKSGPIKDRHVFETPQGVVCIGRKSIHPIPRIPDQFTVDMEMDSVSTTRPMNQKIYFDYHNQVIRIDRIFDKEENHTYGSGLISLIKDYRTGLEYVINRHEDNCTVTQIQQGMIDSGTDQHHHNVTMKHAQELLKFKNMTYVYQGERRWRGLTVDAWANITSSNIVHEYYFLKQPLVKGRPIPPSVVVGLYVKNITAANFKKAEGEKGQPSTSSPKGPLPIPKKIAYKAYEMPAETFINIHNFHEGHPDLDVFDISPCYRMTLEQSHTFTFTTTGNYTEDVYGHRSIFYPAVRNKLAKACGVSLMRITNIQVRQDENDNTKLVINFRLLDKTPMTGDVSNPPKQLSLKTAWKNLMKSTMYGITFPVMYPKGAKVFVAHVYSMQKTSPDVSTQSDNGPTFSSGSVAGLGIGMVILGCVLGLLIAFVIHKRINTEVPYVREG